MTAEPATSELDPESRRSVSALLVRTVVAQALRLVRSLVILPLFAPAALGFYRLLTVTLGYLLHLDIGSFHTLGLEYPRADAAGDRDECQSLARMTWP